MLKETFRFFFPLITGLVLCFLLVPSCAVIKAPTGGPKDTIPPFALGSIPKNYTRNFVGQNITILFNEFIKIKDQSNSIQISPEPEKAPLIKVVQKSIEITFKTPLEKNRTYSINFGNSIIDYNEGNPLNNFRYVFSTGPLLDSLKISGRVSDPLDTSAKKDVYVILHSAGNDSAILKKKPFLFTTTDKDGTFSLENLPAGKYNLYALEETNRNKRYDNKDEKIAFLKNSITLKRDTTGVQLNLFKESDTVLKLMKKSIKAGLFRAIFSIANDSLQFTAGPSIKNKKYIIEPHGKGDSLYIWLANPNQDSILVKVNYKNHKPLLLVQQNFNKPKKIIPFSTEDNIKQDLLSPEEPLSIKFTRPVPILTLENIIIQEDSIKSSPDSVLQADSSFRKYKIYYPWLPNKKYHLKLKAGAIQDIFSATNLEYNHAFTYGEEKNYGIINLHVTIAHPGSYIIELMDDNFHIIKSTIIKENTVIPYHYLIPGKYRIRAIYDTNKNGRFDTGDVMKKIQPERIVNSKEISIRSNFEINPGFPLPN
jgi:uncharacterized protein (DUF2141 family)